MSRLNPVGWVNEPDCGRGTLDILQSTLLTTFFCTYTSLHLNVPPPGTPYLSRLRTHLVWAGATMLAPELLTCIAMTQFLEAVMVLHRLNALYRRYQYHPRAWHNWSLVHAFHYNMRGFVVMHRRWPHRPRVLRMKHLDAIVERDWLPLITKSAEHIKDLSKNDTLAKTVALVQAFWLVAEVLARFTTHLPISPLEISAVAYVACSLFTYLLWLQKPQDVNAPEIVVDPRFGKLFRRNPAAPPFVSSGVYPSSVSSAKASKSTFSTGGSGSGGWKEQLPNLNRGMHTWQQIIMALTFLGVASLFGGLHCLAWNYPFPTEVEKICWRISCVGMIALPPLFYGSRLLWEATRSRHHHHHHDGWKYPYSYAPSYSYPSGDRRRKDQGRLPDFVSLGLICIYVVLRTFNMLEMFAAFRSAPGGLYETVQWTEMLPHW